MTRAWAEGIPGAWVERDGETLGAPTPELSPLNNLVSLLGEARNLGERVIECGKCREEDG